MRSLSENNKNILKILFLSFLCWGGLFFLKGIWWDDWAWVWHYFSSNSLSEFMQPFISLRHEIHGYILFLNFELFETFYGNATNLWNLFKFILFVSNSLFIYFIAKSILQTRTPLPEMIATVYLVSPIVNNLALVTLPYHLYLFFFLASIYFSIKSVSGQEIKIGFYLLAILFALASMVSLESFVFFDVARPVLIFYILLNRGKYKPSKALWFAVLYWIPFLLIGIFALVRVTILYPQSGMYASAYALKPLSVQYLLQIGYRFIVSLDYLFIKAYYFIAKAAFAKKDLFAFILPFAASVYSFVFLNTWRERYIANERKGIGELRIVIFFGIFLIIAGLFPYMLIRDALTFGLASRHGLLANVGLSVFMPAALLLLYYKKVFNKISLHIAFGSIVFFGTLGCNDLVMAYNNDWQQQCLFWDKFMRRVPDIKDGTFLLVDMPRNEKQYFGWWRGEYEFGGPLNLIYAKSRDKNQTDNHFAQTAESAFNPDDECYFLKNQDKVQVEFLSFKGPKRFYPRNLLVALYCDGNFYLNEEAYETGFAGKSHAEFLLGKASADVIIDETKNVDFPLRWIIDNDSEKKGRMDAKE